MSKKRLPAIEVGFQAFAKGAGEESRADRQGRAQDAVIYIEDAGDTVIPLAAVTDVVEGKVIVDTARLEEGVRRAIASAHRDEDYP